MTPAIAARLGPSLATRRCAPSTPSWEAGRAVGELGAGRAHLGHRDHAAEEGPHAGQGVVERMAVIGQRITHAEETVSARPALASEAERLDIRPGGIVLTITRTYRAGQAAGETADIVLPAERYAVSYEVPVR